MFLKLLPLILFLGLASTVTYAELPNVFSNRLMPFKSDGCSSFPDSIGKTSWQQCCVDHDYAYWQGGSKDQKDEADTTFKNCVAEEANSFLGSAMALGVKLGGGAELPTSWRWGYGWVVNRGYDPFGDFEKTQIMLMTSRAPENSVVEIYKKPMVPIRLSISGDYCLDIALTKISDIHSAPEIKYKLIHNEAFTTPRKNSVIKVMHILTDRCNSPYRVEFYLNRENSCTTAANEIVLRKNIRFKQLSGYMCPID